MYGETLEDNNMLIEVYSTLGVVDTFVPVGFMSDGTHL